MSITSCALYAHAALVIGRAVHSPAYVANLLAEAAGSGNASIAQVKSYVADNLKLENYTEAEVSEGLGKY